MQRQTGRLGAMYVFGRLSDGKSAPHSPAERLQILAQMVSENLYVQSRSPPFTNAHTCAMCVHWIPFKTPDGMIILILHCSASGGANGQLYAGVVVALRTHTHTVYTPAFRYHVVTIALTNIYKRELVCSCTAAVSGTSFHHAHPL